MNENWARLPIYVSRPGSGAALREKGLLVEAMFDSGASVSIVPIAIAEKAYGDESFPQGSIMANTMSGKRVSPTAFLTIGVKTSSGDFAFAQIECIISEQLDNPVIGSDVVGQLGLRVTLDYEKKAVLLDSYNWQSFEEEVTALYRLLGATVKQNVPLAGFQIDIVVEETTPSAQHLHIAVECKFYGKQVGNKIVNDFSRVVQTLQENGLVNKGVMVSSSGYSKDARLVAGQTGIDLLTIEDLRQLVKTRGMTPPTISPRKVQRPSFPSSPQPVSDTPQVFVVMPFVPDLDDVYYLGIREVVLKLGGVCERADELQYVGGIVDKIYVSIKNADVVIAELTTPNSNVYYEVGFAHALGKPVILLSQDIKSTSFDLRGYNHVTYSSIVELRERLERMMLELVHLDN